MALQSFAVWSYYLTLRHWLAAHSGLEVRGFVFYLCRFYRLRRERSQVELVLACLSGRRLNGDGCLLRAAGYSVRRPPRRTLRELDRPEDVDELGLDFITCSCCGLERVDQDRRFVAIYSDLRHLFTDSKPASWPKRRRCLWIRVEVVQYASVQTVSTHDSSAIIPPFMR